MKYDNGFMCLVYLAYSLFILNISKLHIHISEVATDEGACFYYNICRTLIDQFLQFYFRMLCWISHVDV